MKELTVSQLRERINNKLNAARLQVSKLEEQLRLFDSLIQEGEDESLTADNTIISPEPKILEKKAFDDEESVGKAITETIRKAEGEFNAHSITKIIKIKFPEVSYGEITKKFAAKAYRLQKRGEIKCVKKGYGRTPHMYKRVTKGGERKED